MIRRQPDVISTVTAMTGALRSRLLQSADIGRDRGDLRLRQIMRDRLHDRRGIRLVGLLAALLLPIRQLPDDVIASAGRRGAGTGRRPWLPRHGMRRTGGRWRYRSRFQKCPCLRPCCPWGRRRAERDRDYGNPPTIP